jgi:hypothetical protein
MEGDTAGLNEELKPGVPESPPLPLPLGPVLASVTFGCGYGTETDALLVGAVPEGRLLFDAAPVSKGVDVALVSGYEANDDSGDAVEVGDATLPMPAETVEFAVDEAVEFW